MSELTPAHDQIITNRYIVHFPDHEPREHDPHYKDFMAFKHKTKATAECAVGAHRKDFSECSLDLPLEVHHSHIEFAVANSVDLKWLAADYPGVDDPEEVGAWIESADNLLWLCVKHHRAAGSGIHHASASDYEAQKYVRGLIGKLEK